jgi:hypothetical protein
LMNRRTVSALEHARLIAAVDEADPELILVVGHESGDSEADAEDGRSNVRRVVKRVRALLLPALTVGVWVNRDGTYQPVQGTGVKDSLESRAILDLEPAA